MIKILITYLINKKLKMGYINKILTNIYCTKREKNTSKHIIIKNVSYLISRHNPNIKEILKIINSIHTPVNNKKIEYELFKFL